jgi:hypothetical protein
MKNSIFTHGEDASGFAFKSTVIGGEVNSVLTHKTQKKTFLFNILDD